VNSLFVEKTNLDTGRGYRSFLMMTGLLLLICIGIRIWFWYATHLTFEDALITFRYAENVASGNGFVYNIDERVLGTTTPLWTFMLAGVKYAGADLFSASKILSILFDTITCLLIAAIMYPFGVRIAVLFAAFFATSPAIIPVTISGMETSLLLCSMSVALLGYTRKDILFGVGLALTILTRIDGILYAAVFAGMGLLRDRKWILRQLVITCLCCLPWYIFSFIYFGNILPQSLLAKRAVYQLEINSSAAPFLGTFTPFLDSHFLKILIKTAMLILLGTGIVLLFRRKSVILPICLFFLLYSLIFMFSRVIIFIWYLIPPIFVSYVLLAVAIDWYISKAQKNISSRILHNALFPFLLIAIFSLNIVFIQVKIENWGQVQKFEKEVRQTIGLWLKNNAKPGSKIFLEPIGYIGYFAGSELNIQDEIGLLTPIAAKHRNNSTNWYIKTVQTLKPDYIIQYAAALKNNEAEGTRAALFTGNEERAWFFSNFQVEKIIKAKGTYPLITQKEKEYIIFKRMDKAF